MKWESVRDWRRPWRAGVPNKGEQTVRYYGHYSNVARGKRKKQDQDSLIPSMLEPEGSSEEFRKNRVRLIKKIYEVDPLTCAKCAGRMKILSFIEDPEIIKKILKHLDLWDVKPRPPPKATGPQKSPKYRIGYSDSQLPVSDNLSRASRSNEWLYVDPEYPEVYPP